MVTSSLTIEDFPERSVDKLRYGDTDRQGHINNARYPTFFETGRTEILHVRSGGMADEGCSFVLARILIEFRSELLWPGTVEIGTRVKKIGNSSITFEQAIFQDGMLAATAESVVVQSNNSTRRSQPLSEQACKRFEALMTGVKV